VLGWKPRAGLATSFGIAFLSVALQILHGLIAGRLADAHVMVVNLLGVISGILFGFNIRALQTQRK
jgi:hypothetical protein